jgi:hypothetical protein
MAGQCQFDPTGFLCGFPDSKETLDSVNDFQHSYLTFGEHENQILGSYIAMFRRTAGTMARYRSL